MRVQIRLISNALRCLVFLLGVASISRGVEESEEDGFEQNRDIFNKGDGERTSTLPSVARLTSVRALSDENRRYSKRDGYRYYGTGSKSGTSFAPTSIHKSTSSLDHNYFVTPNKGHMKDLATSANDLMDSEGNYLTVYEPPGVIGSSSGGGNNRDSAAVLGMDQYYGDMMAEGGHGGYGHVASYGLGGKGCNSALGLLGVLGLAAYLQNVLRNMNGTTGGRRKREVGFDEEEMKLERVMNGMIRLEDYLVPLDGDNGWNNNSQIDKDTYNRIMKDVFPLLGAVAHARDGLIPIHCTHSSVCLANRLLVKDLGNTGRSVGIRISSAIVKLLSRITHDERAEQIRMITKAGKMGRNGRNCLKVFPTCNRLLRLPTYSPPQMILAKDEELEGNSNTTTQ